MGELSGFRVKYETAKAIVSFAESTGVSTQMSDISIAEPEKVTRARQKIQAVNRAGFPKWLSYEGFLRQFGAVRVDTHNLPDRYMQYVPEKHHIKCFHNMTIAYVLELADAGDQEAIRALYNFKRGFPKKPKHTITEYSKGIIRYFTECVREEEIRVAQKEIWEHSNVVWKILACSF